MDKFNLSELITLRSSVAEKMFDADEQENKEKVSYYLSIVDKLSELIKEQEVNRELERGADSAWTQSTYYKEYKDNKAVEEGWKQNWMKVNAEQDIINTFIENDKK